MTTIIKIFCVFLIEKNINLINLVYLTDVFDELSFG